MLNSPRGKGKKIDLEDCVTEYDIMDGDGCLIGLVLIDLGLARICDGVASRNPWVVRGQLKPEKDLSSVHNKLFERVYDFLPGK